MKVSFGNFKARNDSDKSFQKEIKNLEENNKSLNICFVNPIKFDLFFKFL